MISSESSENLIDRDVEGCEVPCGVTVIHSETVAKVKANQIPFQQVAELSTIFQAMGDPTRIRIIHSLAQSEMCVCDIAAILEMTQSAVSHQLKYLRNLKLIQRRKVGRIAYYSICDNHIKNLLETALQHVSKE